MSEDCECLLKSFGLQLKAFRKDKGLSQESLADLCGLDRTYISGLERGRRNPTLCVVARVASALNISISHLLTNIKMEK